MKCAAASAADSVIVMMKSVVANPSRAKDKYLAAPLWKQPLQHCDAALAVGACLGNALIERKAANSVTSTSTRVAIGESTPAARKAIPGWYPRVEK